jgi:hypothetical protein
MYRAVKKIQEEQLVRNQENQTRPSSRDNKNDINAEYTVID